MVMNNLEKHFKYITIGIVKYLITNVMEMYTI